MLNKSFTKGELISTFKQIKTSLDNLRIDEVRDLVDYVLNTELGQNQNLIHEDKPILNNINLQNNPFINAIPRTPLAEPTPNSLLSSDEQQLLDNFFESKIVEIYEDAFNKYLNDTDRGNRHDLAVKIITGELDVNGNPKNK